MREGCNNKFFNLVGHAHPSIWRVIEWCQKEEATVRIIIQQDAVGNPPVKRVNVHNANCLLSTNVGD
jgi:hypothetical protein